MLHAEFQDHRTSCSGEEYFKGYHFGHDDLLGHVNWTNYINVHSPFPRRLHIKFCSASGFSGDV